MAEPRPSTSTIRRHAGAVVLCLLAACGTAPTDAAAATPGDAAAESLYAEAIAAANTPGALDAIARALRAGACPTRTLTERTFAPLRTNARFRTLLLEHARQWDTVLVDDQEPGTPLVVEGTVRGATGVPIPGALVYLFHTDATGTYSDGGLDESRPRLFGCLRSDAAGRFRFRTIRPGHYPDPDEPVEQHIHFVVTGADGVAHECRMGFADDPHWRGRAVPWWAAPVAKDAAGRDVCQFDLVWR